MLKYSRNCVLDICDLDKNKICPIYDNSADNENLATDVYVTTQHNGWKTITFTLNSSVDENENFITTYVKPEYKIRLIDDSGTDWFILNKPAINHSASGKKITITADHCAAILKYRKLELEFSLEKLNNGGYAEDLLATILDGTGWSVGYVYPFVERWDNTQKKYRTFECASKTGAFNMIAKLADLFEAKPIYHGDTQKVDLIPLNPFSKYEFDEHGTPKLDLASGVLEMDYGTNVKSITKSFNSDNITDKLYVYGSYGTTTDPLCGITELVHNKYTIVPTATSIVFEITNPFEPSKKYVKVNNLSNLHNLYYSTLDTQSMSYVYDYTDKVAYPVEVSASGVATGCTTTVEEVQNWTSFIMDFTYYMKNDMLTQDQLNMIARYQYEYPQLLETTYNYNLKYLADLQYLYDLIGTVDFAKLNVYSVSTSSDNLVITLNTDEVLYRSDYTENEENYFIWKTTSGLKTNKLPVDSAASPIYIRHLTNSSCPYERMYFSTIGADSSGRKQLTLIGNTNVTTYSSDDFYLFDNSSVIGKFGEIEVNAEGVVDAAYGYPKGTNVHPVYFRNIVDSSLISGIDEYGWLVKQSTNFDTPSLYFYYKGLDIAWRSAIFSDTQPSGYIYWYDCQNTLLYMLNDSGNYELFYDPDAQASEEKAKRKKVFEKFVQVQIYADQYSQDWKGLYEQYVITPGTLATGYYYLEDDYHKGYLFHNMETRFSSTYYVVNPWENTITPIVPSGTQTDILSGKTWSNVIIDETGLERPDDNYKSILDNIAVYENSRYKLQGNAAGTYTVNWYNKNLICIKQTKVVLNTSGSEEIYAPYNSSFCKVTKPSGTRMYLYYTSSTYDQIETQAVMLYSSTITRHKENEFEDLVWSKGALDSSGGQITDNTKDRSSFIRIFEDSPYTITQNMLTKTFRVVYDIFVYDSNNNFIYQTQIVLTGNTSKTITFSHSTKHPYYIRLVRTFGFMQSGTRATWTKVEDNKYTTSLRITDEDITKPIEITIDDPEIGGALTYEYITDDSGTTWLVLTVIDPVISPVEDPPGISIISYPKCSYITLTMQAVNYKDYIIYDDKQYKFLYKMTNSSSEGQGDLLGLYYLSQKSFEIADQVYITDRALIAASEVEEDDLDEEITISLGEIYKENFWQDSSYVDGQQKRLFFDAVDRLEDASQPKTTYTIDYIDLYGSDYEEDIKWPDIDINYAIHITDEEIDTNKWAYVDTIKKCYDMPWKTQITVNTDLTDSSNQTFDDVISAFADTTSAVSANEAVIASVDGVVSGRELIASKISGAINAAKASLVGAASSWYTDEKGNIIFESASGNSAMKLAGAGFCIANNKDEWGDWLWTTFGTGDGFCADFINTGTLRANLIEAGSITVDKVSSTFGASLDISSNEEVMLFATVDGSRPAGTVDVHSLSGQSFIRINPNEGITLASGANISMVSGSAINMTGADINIKADSSFAETGNINIEAGGNLNMLASNINITADPTDPEQKGQLLLKGSIVDIDAGSTFTAHDENQNSIVMDKNGMTVSGEKISLLTNGTTNGVILLGSEANYITSDGIIHLHSDDMIINGTDGTITTTSNAAINAGGAVNINAGGNINLTTDTSALNMTAGTITATGGSILADGAIVNIKATSTLDIMSPNFKVISSTGAVEVAGNIIASSGQLGATYNSTTQLWTGGWIITSDKIYSGDAATTNYIELNSNNSSAKNWTIKVGGSINPEDPPETDIFGIPYENPSNASKATFGVRRDGVVLINKLVRYKDKEQTKLETLDLRASLWQLNYGLSNVVAEQDEGTGQVKMTFTRTGTSEIVVNFTSGAAQKPVTFSLSQTGETAESTPFSIKLYNAKGKEITTLAGGTLTELMMYNDGKITGIAKLNGTSGSYSTDVYATLDKTIGFAAGGTSNVGISFDNTTIITQPLTAAQTYWEPQTQTLNTNVFVGDPSGTTYGNIRVKADILLGLDEVTTEKKYIVDDTSVKYAVNKNITGDSYLYKGTGHLAINPETTTLQYLRKNTAYTASSINGYTSVTTIPVNIRGKAATADAVNVLDGESFYAGSAEYYCVDPYDVGSATEADTSKGRGATFRRFRENTPYTVGEPTMTQGWPAEAESVKVLDGESFYAGDAEYYCVDPYETGSATEADTANGRAATFRRFRENTPYTVGEPTMTQGWPAEAEAVSVLTGETTTASAATYTCDTSTPFKVTGAIEADTDNGMAATFRRFRENTPYTVGEETTAQGWPAEPTSVDLATTAYTMCSDSTAYLRGTTVVPSKQSIIKASGDPTYFNSTTNLYTRSSAGNILTGATAVTATGKLQSTSGIDVAICSTGKIVVDYTSSKSITAGTTYYKSGGWQEKVTKIGSTSISVSAVYVTLSMAPMYVYGNTSYHSNGTYYMSGGDVAGHYKLGDDVTVYDVGSKGTWYKNGTAYDSAYYSTNKAYNITTGGSQYYAAATTDDVYYSSTQPYTGTYVTDKYFASDDYVTNAYLSSSVTGTAYYKAAGSATYYDVGSADTLYKGDGGLVSYCSSHKATEVPGIVYKKETDDKTYCPIANHYKAGEYTVMPVTLASGTPTQGTILYENYYTDTDGKYVCIPKTQSSGYMMYPSNGAISKVDITAPEYLYKPSEECCTIPSSYANKTVGEITEDTATYCKIANHYKAGTQEVMPVTLASGTPIQGTILYENYSTDTNGKYVCIPATQSSGYMMYPAKGTVKTVDSAAPDKLYSPSEEQHAIINASYSGKELGLIKEDTETYCKIAGHYKAGTQEVMPVTLASGTPAQGTILYENYSTDTNGKYVCIPETQSSGYMMYPSKGTVKTVDSSVTAKTLYSPSEQQHAIINAAYEGKEIGLIKEDSTTYCKVADKYLDGGEQNYYPSVVQLYKEDSEKKIVVLEGGTAGTDYYEGNGTAYIVEGEKEEQFYHASEDEYRAFELAAPNRLYAATEETYPVLFDSAQTGSTEYYQKGNETSVVDTTKTLYTLKN